MPGLKAHSAESFKAPPIFHAVAEALLDYVASLHSLWGFEPWRIEWFVFTLFPWGR